MKEILRFNLCGLMVMLPVFQVNAYEETAFTERGVPMDEIIVYSRKRIENIIDVPATVGILSSAMITEKSLMGLKDVAAFTSNFSYDEGFGRNNLQRPVIRGMSNILGAANAGFFVDGIYVPGGIASTALFDLERVEIIKGPGSALYGRATLSGAINYITKRPGDIWAGQVSATAASHDEFRLTGHVSGPLIEDKAGLSLSLRHYSYGGEYENTGPGGGMVGQEESQSISGGLTLYPSDNFGAYLRIYYQKDDDGLAANALQPASENNCFLDTTQYYCGEIISPKSVALNQDVFEDPGLEREIFRTSLIMDWEVEDYRISSLSSYSKDQLTDQRDSDFLPIAALGGAFHIMSDTDIESLSQEIRINSNDGGSFRWLLGGYYYHEEINDSLSTPFSVRPSTSISPVAKVDNYAVFASVELDVSEKLTATIEMRRNWDKISIGTDAGTQSNIFKSFTPRFALKFKISPQARVYMTVAKGTKPGGFNEDLYGTAVPESERIRLANYLTYAEERVWNYEVGAKTSWLDGKIYINLAGFFIDWTEQQLSTSFPVIGHRRARPLIHNAGKTEVWGFEAEIQANPNDQLSISASYGYANGEFKKFEDETHAALTGEASVAGNRTPRAPKHSFNLSSRYVTPINDRMDFFLRGDVNYKSSRFVQVHNLAIIGATTKVNLHIGIEWQDVSVTGFVKNLFNDDTPADVTRFFDASSPFMPRAFLVTLPKSRQFGVTINYNF